MASRRAGFPGVISVSPPATSLPSSAPRSEPTTSSSFRITMGARPHGPAQAALTDITALDLCRLRILSPQNALRASWRGLFNRHWSNEMSLGYRGTGTRIPASIARNIKVQADSGGIEASPWDAGGNPAVMGDDTGIHRQCDGWHGEARGDVRDPWGTAPVPGQLVPRLRRRVALRVPRRARRRTAQTTIPARCPARCSAQGPVVNFHARQLGLYAPGPVGRSLPG